MRLRKLTEESTIAGETDAGYIAFADLEKYRQHLAADVARFRTDSHVLRAVAATGGTHEVDDVIAAIEGGTMQLWCGPQSHIVTELQQFPRQRHLNVFLAAGSMREIEAMLPHIYEWGRLQGCVKATFTGRLGWLRSPARHRNTEWKARAVLAEKTL